MQKYILDDAGALVPCDDLLEWGRWFESGNRRQEVSWVGDVRVSTIFLGLDHRFDNDGEPLLWETMIFGGAHDGEQWRYSSQADADAGHRHAVKRVESGL